MKPSVLVTGASGYIGESLVRALVGGGAHSVISLYRSKIPENQENSFPFCSDLMDAKLLMAPLRGVDTVVHLAWDALYPKQNEVFLGNLLTAMEATGVKKIILLSFAGASRSAKLELQKQKYMGELQVLNARIPQRVILRSPLVFGGKRDRVLKTFLKYCQGPVFFPVPSRQEIALIHLDDLTKEILHHVKKDGTSLVVRECDRSSLNSLREVMLTCAKSLGKGVRVPLTHVLGRFGFSLLSRLYMNDLACLDLGRYVEFSQSLKDKETQTWKAEIKFKEAYSPS